MAEIKESVVLELRGEGAARTASTLNSSFDRLVAAIDRLENRLDATSASTRQLDAAERRAGTTAARTTQQFTAQAAALRRTESASRRASRGIGEAARRYAASASAAQSAIIPIGRLAALFGAGLGIRAVLQDLAAFDRGLTQVQAISRSTDAELQRIKQTALELGATTPKSASEALQGAVQLARAGFSAREIPEALPATLNLAVTAQLDLARASEISANAVRQFGLQAGDTTRITDALTVAANNANTDVSDLAQALGFAGPLAGALGVDLEQTVAALGAISDGGIKATRAGTGLAGIFRRLANPLEKGRKELDRIGINIDDLDPRTRDFSQVVGLLGEAYRRGADFAKVFEAEQVAAALVLAQLEERFATLLVKQRESIDAAGDQAKAYGEDLQGALTTFSSTVDSLTKKAGDEGLTGALKGIVRFATDTLRALGDIDTEGRQAAQGAQIAASAIEGLALALGGLAVLRVGAGLLAALTNPFTATAVAIGGAITLARQYGREIENLKRGSFELTAEVQKSLRSVEQFQERFAALGKRDIGPLTQQDALDRQIRRLDLIAQQAARVRSEVEAIGTETGRKPRQFETLDDLAQKLQKAREEARQAQLQFDIATKPLAELQDRLTAQQYVNLAAQRGAGTPQPTEEALNRLIGKLGDANERVQELENAVAQIEGRPFVSTAAIRPIAEAAGKLDELEAAESRATQGFIEYVDALRLVESIQSDAGLRAAALREELEGIANAGKDASAPLQKGVADIAPAIDVVRKATREIEDQIVAAAQAADAGEDYERALIRVADAQEIQRRKAEIIAEVTKAGNRVTQDQVDTIDRSVRAYVEARRLVEDFIGSLNAKARAEEEAARAAERAADLERRAREQAAERARADAEAAVDRAAQILTSLRLEAASYTKTRDAVDRLALAEELRHLAVSDQTKQRILLAQREIEALRQAREVGDAVAGGFGDSLRAIREGAGGSEALAAALEGVGTRIFESSVARIEETISASITEGLVPSIPTVGETQIEIAVRAVEAAIYSTGAQSAAASQAAAGQVAASVGFAGRVGSVGQPGVQGPPVPGSESDGGGSFLGSFGGALAGAGIGLGLSLLLSRLSEDREDGGRSGVGFRVLGANRGTTVNVDNRKSVIYQQTPTRSLDRTSQMRREDRSRRW